MASRLLARLGFDVLSAPSGRETLGTVARHPTEPRFILLDLSMPGLDRVDTLRQLQRIKPGVRVIVSSGYAEQECQRRFEGLPVAGFIHKPYGFEDLRAKIREALGE